MQICSILLLTRIFIYLFAFALDMLGRRTNAVLHSPPLSYGCRQELLCGHQCQGTCGQCKKGRLHVPCEKKCRKILVCGHDCPASCCQCPPCSTPCQNRSVPLHPLSEQVRASPPAVRTGQCLSTCCQNRSVFTQPLSKRVTCVPISARTNECCSSLC